MTAPHYRPTAGEWTEAVREFLETDVVTNTAGRAWWPARVAVHALRMVERELESAPELAARHMRRLEELGFADDAELAQSIRRGDLDDRYREIKNSIRESVSDKLRVANPGYLET